MIDFSKPIEYIDGSPANYRGRDDENYVVTPRGFPESDTGNFYNTAGTHVYGIYDAIRNVAEKAPALDLTKPVQTRDGRKVTILATGVVAKLPNSYTWYEGQSVVGQVGDETSLRYWHPNGSYMEPDVTCETDLVNVPEKPVQHEVFVSLGEGRNTLEAAKRACHFDWPVVRMVLEGDKVISSEVIGGTEHDYGRLIA